MQGREAAVAVGAVVLVILAFGLLGGGMMAGGSMMGWGGFGFGPVWGLMMLVFWALIIGGALLLVGAFVRQGPSASDAGNSRALDILRERYARGEITGEQYEQMRDDLTVR